MITNREKLKPVAATQYATKYTSSSEELNWVKYITMNI